jgi:dTDP-glucose 4,6-dehydratase
VLLEAALRWWSRLSGARRDRFRFVQVSSDEVFGSLDAGGIFTIESRYAPNSPYAATKAAGDHLARAWHRTYGLPVVVTNCANNYGPWQHAEKLIPTIIRHAIAGTPVPIYGTGANVRDWLYVDDHADGLMRAAELGRPGETYLFGGRSEMTNLALAEAICALLDARRPRADGRPYSRQIAFVADRPGHDFRYAVDPRSSERALGWRGTTPLDAGLGRTLDWYLANPAGLSPAHGLGRLGRGRTLESRGAADA